MWYRKSTKNPSVEGVKVAVYVVPEPVKLVSVPPPVTVTFADVKSLVDSLDPVKLVSVPPPVTVTFADVKSLVDSLDVNVKLMLASFEIKPLIPSAAVIVIVGDVVSPSVEGVKVAVYVVPEPVKLVSVPPPVTVTFADVKSLVDSLDSL
ncbi:unnamed protein product [Bathycoccus prasinos]